MTHLLALKIELWLQCEMFGVFIHHFVQAGWNMR